MFLCGTGVGFPSTGTCGDATFSIRASGLVDVTLRDIPGGAKMRSATKSSQLCPDTA